MKPFAIVQLLIVGAGGFIGSVARYLVSGLAQRFDPVGSFPYGTMSVNVIGCFVIGVLGGLADARQVIGPGFRLFLFIGLLGGFTTFSSFGHETLGLLRDGENLKALVNTFGTLALCLVSVWIGYGLGNVR